MVSPSPYSVVYLNRKVHYLAGSLFLTITWSGCQAKIKWYVCISKSLRTLCVSLFRTDSGSGIYHLFLWTNFNFFHNYQWSRRVDASTLFFLLFIFTAVKRFSLAVNSTLQFFMVSAEKFITLIFVHFHIIYYPVLQDHIVCPFVVNPRHNYIISFCFRCVDQCIGDLFLSFLVASFLYFEEQSTAYYWLINLLPNLCYNDFPHHQLVRYVSIVVKEDFCLGIILDQSGLAFGHTFGYICSF